MKTSDFYYDLPENLIARYRKINNCKFRLMYVAFCFVYCLGYITYISVFGHSTLLSGLLGLLMLFFFFTGGAELLTGAFSKAIKKSLFRRVDRDLMQWRYENGYI